MSGCNFLSNECEKVLLAKPILQFHWTRTSNIYSEAQITWSYVEGDIKVLVEREDIERVLLDYESFIQFSE
jgi:hypothetical protein